MIHHELNHVLFQHIFAPPARDRRARVIAEEVTANEWVIGPLPGHPITLALFPALPSNEDTDTRYRKLARAGTATLPTIITLDDHDLWAEARGQATRARLAVQAHVQEAAATVNAAEWESLPVPLRRHIHQMIPGNGRSHATEAVDALAAGRLDWPRALRRYLGRELRQTATYARPPRRLPEMAGLIPGKAQRFARPVVMAVIDTSASMSKELLSLIGAELGRLAATTEVIVVECDAAIRRSYRYAGRLREVQGRGGTDLRPPFAPAFVRSQHPDLIVVFTDGHGPAPAAPPSIPVIWCITPDGARPAPWGRYLNLGRK